VQRLRSLKPEIVLIVLVFAAAWAFGAYQAVVTSPAPGDETRAELDLSGRSNVVVLKQAQYDFLKESSNPQLETGWCILGRRAKNDIYRIDDIAMAEMLDRSRGHIRMRCESSDAMLGHIHSHPVSNIPMPSQQDVRSYFQSEDVPDRYIEGIFTARDHELRFYRQIGERKALSLMDLEIIEAE